MVLNKNHIIVILEYLYLYWPHKIRFSVSLDYFLCSPGKFSSSFIRFQLSSTPLGMSVEPVLVHFQNSEHINSFDTEQQDRGQHQQKEVSK